MFLNSEIIEMERRANAILNGRKRSTILSTSAPTKPKSTESTSDAKKNRYTFTLLKKGNKQVSESKLKSVDDNLSSNGNDGAPLKLPLDAPLDSDLIESSELISHAGKH